MLHVSSRLTENLPPPKKNYRINLRKELHDKNSIQDALAN
jgi:hypothetical protein